MVLPVIVAPAARRRSMATACRAAGRADASQSGLPPPVRLPAMSYMSLTTAVKPASGPSAAPRTGASRSWGTKNDPLISLATAVCRLDNGPPFLDLRLVERGE